MTAEATIQQNTTRRWRIGRGWLVALCLGLAPVAAYWNSLHVPFVLDDAPVITDNPSIRSLWPLTGPLSPPAGGLPVSSRPVANLSFAVNHALGGEAVEGYHAVSIGLHVLAGLALFGVLRRTLARPVVPAGIRAAAEGLALAIATLWALHPLQTAAVTYVSQRTELLASLCYLLTLLAFIRAAECPVPAKAWWAAAAFVACLTGMGCKETMASAPIVVLLYDRAFLAGSFAEAWRRRRGLHLALMSTWALLGWLVWHSADRGGTAGWGVSVSPAAYALTQAEAIPSYLLRSVWPHPLVFDYGEYLATPGWRMMPGIVVVAGLVAWAVVAQWRWPAAGWAGALFLGVLAPSSSFVPVATQTVAEHRMYLPLAVVLAAVVLGAYFWLGRRARFLLPVAALLAAGLTVARNTDYASAVTLWRDTVHKRPDNIRARNNLAASLLEANQTEAGLVELQAALELQPDHPDVLRNLARAELVAGRTAAALAHIERAQRLDPRVAAGWTLLGAARLQAGQAAGAAEAYQRAADMRPDRVAAHLGLGEARAALRDLPGAAAAFTEARRLQPDSAEAAFGLAQALFLLERDREAIALFEELKKRQPDYPGLRLNHGAVLLEVGRPAEALAEFDAARTHGPPEAQLLHLRALALVQLDRTAEAAAAVRELLQVAPDYAPGRDMARELQLDRR